MLAAPLTKRSLAFRRGGDAAPLRVRVAGPALPLLDRSTREKALASLARSPLRVDPSPRRLALARLLSTQSDSANVEASAGRAWVSSDRHAARGERHGHRNPLPSDLSSSTEDRLRPCGAAPAHDCLSSSMRSLRFGRRINGYPPAVRRLLEECSRRPVCATAARDRRVRRGWPCGRLARGGRPTARHVAAGSARPARGESCRPRPPRRARLALPPNLSDRHSHLWQHFGNVHMVRCV
jgi:hypothetical protein